MVVGSSTSLVRKQVTTRGSWLCSGEYGLCQFDQDFSIEVGSTGVTGFWDSGGLEYFWVGSFGNSQSVLPFGTGDLDFHSKPTVL